MPRATCLGPCALCLFGGVIGAPCHVPQVMRPLSAWQLYIGYSDVNHVSHLLLPSPLSKVGSPQPWPLSSLKSRLLLLLLPPLHHVICGCVFPARVSATHHHFVVIILVPYSKVSLRRRWLTSVSPSPPQAILKTFYCWPPVLSRVSPLRTCKPFSQPFITLISALLPFDHRYARGAGISPPFLSATFLSFGWLRIPNGQGLWISAAMIL